MFILDAIMNIFKFDIPKPNIYLLLQAEAEVAQLVEH